MVPLKTSENMHWIARFHQDSKNEQNMNWTEPVQAAELMVGKGPLKGVRATNMSLKLLTLC